MDIHSKQITGKNKTICEDFIYLTKSTSSYCFAGMADGQSQKNYCIEGGKAALTAIDDYLRQQNLASLLNRYPDEVQYELIHTLRQRLSILAQIRKADINDFSSTICAVAANPIDKSFLLVHLGDGCIIGLTTDNQLKILSMPENGITRFHTYLTTSPTALTHIRLSRGNLNNYKAIYIMTDGANCISKNGSIEKKARNLLLQRNFDELCRLLEESRPCDDASLIMVSI